MPELYTDTHARACAHTHIHTYIAKPPPANRSRHITHNQGTQTYKKSISPFLSSSQIHLHPHISQSLRPPNKPYMYGNCDRGITRQQKVYVTVNNNVNLMI